MAYFDTVHNASTFQEKAMSEKAKKLSLVLKPEGSRFIPVSSWGREHLFALRVLCKKSNTKGAYLPLLEPYLLNSWTPFRDPNILALVSGPEQDIQELAKMSEFIIVRLYDSGAVGYTWAALGALFRQWGDEDGQGQREDVEGRQPGCLGKPVPTNSALSGIPKSGSSSNAGNSGGYEENPHYPDLEDLTMSLARSFVRLVLSFGQKPNIQKLYAEFRQERVSTNYRLQASPNYILRTIDEGGVRLFLRGEISPIVALIEAKRRFQDVEDGKPIVSDRLLAQMAGQALLVLLDKTRRTIFDTSVITIQVTGHYMKFFSFECSPSYLEEFESLSPNDNSTLYFSVSSSDWFDITTEGGREMAVRHILALVEWAHDGMRDESGEESSGDTDME